MRSYNPLPLSPPPPARAPRRMLAWKTERFRRAAPAKHMSFGCAGRTVHVSAVVAEAETTDLGALLRDSLQQRPKAEAPAVQTPMPVEASPTPAPPAAPAPAPAPPQAFRALGDEAASAGGSQSQGSAPGLAPAAPSLQMPESSPPRGGTLPTEGASTGMTWMHPVPEDMAAAQLSLKRIDSVYNRTYGILCCFSQAISRSLR